MINVKLSNCVEIPMVGLGVFRSKNGTETTNAVKWAIEAGYRHIDTAMRYKNETSVAQGIKESGVDRKDIFVTTKLWNDSIRQGNFREAFETSLELLDTDYLDLYLIHWPAENHQNAWIELEKLYEEKKIRAIGVSNFHKHHLEELFKICKIKPMVNQIESHPIMSNQDLIDFCHKEGIAVQAWSPLGGDGAPLLSDATINKIAQKYAKSPAQIIIRWNVQRGVIVLPKSVNKDRIKSNIDVFDFELSTEDMLSINALNQNKRIWQDPDNFNF